MIAPRTSIPFGLGQLLATPGALAAIGRAGQAPAAFINRHAAGDWGEACGGDRALNDEALGSGGRLHSSYRTSLGERIWVITESDRSATTLLLPDEY